MKQIGPLNDILGAWRMKIFAIYFVICPNSTTFAPPLEKAPLVEGYLQAR